MRNTKGIISVEVVEVIKTKTVIGSGTTEEDPVRTIVQYWDKGGKLIGKEDPFTKKYLAKVRKNRGSNSSGGGAPESKQSIPISCPQRR